MSDEFEEDYDENTGIGIYGDGNDGDGDVDEPYTPPAPPQHTPEPWTIGKSHHDCSSTILWHDPEIENEPYELMESLLAPTLSDPNIDRAVACVNALAGIPDPVEYVAAMGELVAAGRNALPVLGPMLEYLEDAADMVEMDTVAKEETLLGAAEDLLTEMGHTEEGIGNSIILNKYKDLLQAVQNFRNE